MVGSYVHVLCIQALLTPSRVLNLDSQSNRRRDLKPSSDKEDRQKQRNERERVRPVAETAEESSESLSKLRERDCAVWAPSVRLLSVAMQLSGVELPKL